MQFEYTVIYSKRKTLSIIVERDRSVIVRSPEGLSKERIEKIVDSKRQWLAEKTNHKQKYELSAHPPGKELVTGESMPYLGRNYRIEITGPKAEVYFNNAFILPDVDPNEIRVAFRQWYVKKAAQKILPRVLRTAKTLGVTFNEAKLSNSRFQWGSCTPKNNVIFNWRLIKAPMYVIDYVIVHELAHLIEPNHTSRFWNIVRTHVANLQKAKGWLKEHGEMLEQDI